VSTEKQFVLRFFLDVSQPDVYAIEKCMMEGYLTDLTMGGVGTNNILANIYKRLLHNSSQCN
jgi:hypothetical protein